MTELYTMESIQDAINREKIMTELSGKIFRAQIENAYETFAFAINENFDTVLFIPPAVFSDLGYPQKDSIIEVQVSSRYDKKFERWNFIAKSGKCISREKPLKEKGRVDSDKPKPSPRKPSPKAKQKTSSEKRGQIKSLPPYISVYIDESWPGTHPDIKSPKYEGIIAGIVWLGQHPNEKELPFISNHLRDPDLIYAGLKNIENAARCFPFIMSIRLDDETENAQRFYDELLQTCVKVLLGWLLQTNSHDVKQVSFHMENIGGHIAGENVKGKFEGYLAALKERAPQRFNQWKVHQAHFVDKEFEYIPYGDLLAYVALETNPNIKKIGEKFNYKNLPGYLPITLDLSQQLDDIDRLEELGNVDQVLNFLIDTRGTALCNIVMADLKGRLAARQDLQEKLLVSLEERYQNKARDLRQLRTLSNDVIRLISILPDDLPKHIQMIFFALQLQKANHHGDPESAGKVRERYQAIQDDLRIHDREFAAYVDLNVAVSYADSFQFHQAQATVDAILHDQFFGALTPAMQGRAHSAAGQYYSMLGAYEKAEASFALALEKFEVADLKEAQKKGECQQTGIYRAINAMDASFPTARDLVHRIVALEAKEIGEIAKDVSHDHEYRHHLLLRALYLVPELHPLRQYYLKEMDDWESALQHPWELINLYRALLIIDSDISDARNLANHYFDQAFMICCDEEHGLILNLLGVMVATVALCVTGTQSYYNEGQVILNRIGNRLPGAAPAIQVLQEVLDAPAPEKVSHVLNCLPFNYH